MRFPTIVFTLLVGIYLIQIIYTNESNASKKILVEYFLTYK
jgi:hypothetical protein